VGNPAFKPDGDPFLPALPGAEAEVRAVASLVRAHPFIGAAASLDTIRTLARTADLLYFATHGVADPLDPLDGGALFFADDARWTVKEVLNTPLQAYLAVLSACQTGLGRADAAGVVGLARAFSLQGVNHVVMSLWKVDDDATAFLMTRFMTTLREGCLKSGCEVASALRTAMLEARAQYPGDPARWASFLHFGVDQ
jgi:CHAT domain-containing protein